MAIPARLDTALKRLSTVLDQLEAATERAGRANAEKRDLTDTLAVMQDDRGRLANELDAALTRTQTLERATAEVAQRLGGVRGTLRHLLDADARAPDAVSVDGPRS